MKENENYFYLEFRESVNEMLFQRREFFISQVALDKRISFLERYPDRYCDIVRGTFHVDVINSEVING